MKLKYLGSRIVAVKGPYIFVGGGYNVKIKKGEVVDVPDEHAYKILSKDGDVVVQTDEEIKQPAQPAKKRGRPPKKDKMMTEYQNKSDDLSDAVKL